MSFENVFFLCLHVHLICALNYYLLTYLHIALDCYANKNRPRGEAYAETEEASYYFYGNVGPTCCSIFHLLKISHSFQGKGCYNR